MPKRKITYNTTGGAGYIPPSNPGAIAQLLRDQAYSRIKPVGYTYDNAKAFFKKKRGRLYSDPNTEALWGKYTGQDSIIADYTQAPKQMPMGRPITKAEGIALGFPPEDSYPRDLAKYAVKDIVIPSRSKEGAYELAYPNQEGSVPHLPYSSNDIQQDRWLHSHQLGSFQQKKGQDEKGTYVTYEDTWDINPFKGQSSQDDSSWKWFIDKGKDLGLDKIGDIVPFGKPFEIHGKQYYDKNGKPINQKSEGGPINKRKLWDELSMPERAAMMRVAVRNGITNLSDIREKYNEFAQGGNTKSDDDLIDRIIQEEGFSKKPEDIGDGKMSLGSGLTAKKWHDLYEKRGNKWSAADNRRAVAEEVANRRRWAERNIPNWEKLPDSSQKALLSYKYNYDFTRSNSPKLFKALEAGNLQEAARQMDATSKDPKFKKGLQARRQREQDWFLSDLNQRPTTTIPVETPVSTAIYNPFAIQQQTTQAYPIMVPDEDSYVTAHPLTTGELKAQEMKERFDAVNRFNALMNMIGFENNPLPSFTSTSNVFLDSLSPLINGNADGGKIYIKPSHRGRLTELKARTGKTEAELYNDGNPAHKRMVVFARNSRKWKHGLGGFLI